MSNISSTQFQSDQGKQGSRAAKQALIEIHRREQLVKKAMELLVRLKTLSAGLAKSTGNSSPNPAPKLAFEGKSALAVLLSEDELSALIFELESEIEHCQGLLDENEKFAAFILFQQLGRLMAPAPCISTDLQLSI